MKKIGGVVIKNRLGILAVLILFLSFSVNFFGVGNSRDWFYDFQNDSSFLVEKVSVCKNRQNYYSGILNYSSLETRGSNSCAEKDNVPYTPQFGLQARVISFLSPSNPEALTNYFKSIELTFALITALMLTAVVIKTRQLFGLIPAVTLLLGVSLSPWIAVYAHNLYWVFPLTVAPFVIVYCFYDRLKGIGKEWLLYLLVFILFYIKLLNGYEHITTIVISVCATIVLFEYDLMRKLWRKVALRFATVLFLSVIAFMLAVATNVAGLNEYYHSTDKSLDKIAERAESRGVANMENLQADVVVGFKYTLPDVYYGTDQLLGIAKLEDGNSSSMYYFVISYVNYLLLPAVNLPIRSESLFWTGIQSIFTVGAIGVIAGVRNMRKAGYDSRDKALLAGTLIGLGGALSWLVLMPGHAYPHAHLNGIIFYLPFMLFVYIAIGRYIQLRLNIYKARYAK